MPQRPTPLNPAIHPPLPLLFHPPFPLNSLNDPMDPSPFRDRLWSAPPHTRFCLSLFRRHLTTPPSYSSSHLRPEPYSQPFFTTPSLCNHHSCPHSMALSSSSSRSRSHHRISSLHPQWHKTHRAMGNISLSAFSRYSFLPPHHVNAFSPNSFSSPAQFRPLSSSRSSPRTPTRDDPIPRSP